MNKTKSATILIRLGALLIAAALALTWYNMVLDNRAKKEANSVLQQLGQYPNDMYEGMTPDYILNPEMDMPTIEIDGYKYIGTLSVPSLGIELPVMESWDYTRMRIAPCRYGGSAYLNNMIICGHNYVSHLGKLRRLQIGDAVLFTDADGNKFVYKAQKIETLSERAVEEMQSGEWDLTVFTCTIGGRARIAVRCVLDR